MLKLLLSDIGSPFIPHIMQDYRAGVESLESFRERAPTVASLDTFANQRVFSQTKRDILVEALIRQYHAIDGKQQSVLDNINLLGHDTSFTLTSGQQVHIFLGPLFCISKILDTIALAKSTQNKFPDKNFIPVFWMASEDHDFEEIRHTRVYNDIFTREGVTVGGPVGRLDPSSLVPMVESIRQRLDPTEFNQTEMDIFAYAYSHFPTIAQATHYVLDSLFGDQGLVVIDADDAALKELFIPIMEQDIFEQASFTSLTSQTDKLIAAGYKKQANPREINMFYMTDSYRGRIIHDGEHYSVDGSDQVFTHDELQHLLLTSPASFSPNVFLRPLYQETILTNLCYLPGPGELNYRLQMKTLFAHYDLVMPVLIPRTLYQYLSTKNYTKLLAGPIPLSRYFDMYDDFLEYIQSIDTTIMAETKQKVDNSLQSISLLQQHITDQHIDTKKIARSLAIINHELTSLASLTESSSKDALETSETYGPYIKLKKTLFSEESRFERDKDVVGQLSLVDAMITLSRESTGDEESFGGVGLYVYD